MKLTKLLLQAEQALGTDLGKNIEEITWEDIKQRADVVRGPVEGRKYIQIQNQRDLDQWIAAINRLPGLTSSATGNVHLRRITPDLPGVAHPKSYFQLFFNTAKFKDIAGI